MPFLDGYRLSRLPHPVAPPYAPVFPLTMTGELFLDYDDYLSRLAFLESKIFSCEATGTPALSYRAALNSERAFLERLIKEFSLPWLQLVFETVHYSVYEIDILADMILEKLKMSILPGEVAYMLEGKEYIPIHFIQIPTPSLPTEWAPNDIFVVKQLDTDLPPLSIPYSQIKREKNRFNRKVLKKFIKDSTTRETWRAAPWILHRFLVEQFHVQAKPSAELLEHIAARERGEYVSPPPVIVEPEEVDNEVPSTGDIHVKLTILGRGRRVEYPMDDLELMARGDKTSTSLGKLPDPNLDFGIPKDLVSKVLTTWSFLTSFSRPLKLSPFTMDDYTKALSHSSGKSCVLLIEVFGALLSVLCKHWVPMLPVTEVRNDVSEDRSMIEEMSIESIEPIVSKPEHPDKPLVDQLLDGLSPNERMCIDSWYGWYAGRWDTGVDDVKAAGKVVPSINRLKACEVALAGFIKDGISDELYPEKWSILQKLLGSLSSDTLEPSLNLESVPSDLSDVSGIEDSSAEESMSEEGPRISSRLKNKSEPSRSTPEISKPARRKKETKKSKKTSQKKKREVSEEDKEFLKTVQDFLKRVQRNLYSLSMRERLLLIDIMIESHVIQSPSIRQAMEDSIERVSDLKKELRDVIRDRKNIQQAKTDVRKDYRKKLTDAAEEFAEGLPTSDLGLDTDEGIEDESAPVSGAEDTGRSIRSNAKKATAKIGQSIKKQEMVSISKDRTKPKVTLELKQREQNRLNQAIDKLDKELGPIEQREAELKAEIELEMGMTRCFPLGYDRYCNRYWFLDTSVIPFLSEPLDEKEEGKQTVSGIADYGTGMILVELFELEKHPRIFTREYDPVHRGMKHGTWGYYSTVEQMDQIIASLDTRGERESLLYKELLRLRMSIGATMIHRGEDMECIAAQSGVYEPYLNYINCLAT